MKELLRKMNNVDVGALFTKKTSSIAASKKVEGELGGDKATDPLNINWQEVPKPIIAGVVLGGSLMLYGLSGLYQLYSAYSGLSDSELRWQQAMQQHLSVSQQIDIKVENSKNLIKENTPLISSKSELEKYIYLFHKSAGLEIKKTNEEEVNGIRYSNFLAEGDFTGIQSMLKDMNSISIYTAINMIDVAVLQEKNKLQLQMQLNFIDVAPLKSIISEKKMTYMDGGGPVSHSLFRRIQFVPLNNSDVKPDTPRNTETLKRDPFFKPQIKESESLPIPGAVNPYGSATSNDASSQVQEQTATVLRGCITAEAMKGCIYQMPNKSIIFRAIGEDVLKGIRQVEIAHHSVKLKKGNKVQTVQVGEQIHE